MEAGGLGGWNQAPLPRDQILLFHETLGDRIPQNNSVRLFAEILAGLDWSSWERHYVLVAGQPPIHPKVMAGAILYGLTHGLRSSWRLEWACEHAIDFLWLVEGRTIDHSTFCDFRTKFKRELKDLFRRTGRVAMRLGLISLNQVASGGTRVRANSSPSNIKKLVSALGKLCAGACSDRPERHMGGVRGHGFRCLTAMRSRNRHEPVASR